MNKEIIELLESALCPNVTNGCQDGIMPNPYGEMEQCQWCNEKNQALTKLREQPPAGEFTKLARDFLPPREVFENISATELSEQPGQLERLLLKACDIIDQQTEQEKMDMETIGRFDKENKQFQARLDSAEAINTDLLEACRLALEEWYPELPVCAKPDCSVCVRQKKEKAQIEAAIARGKKEE